MQGPLPVTASFMGLLSPWVARQRWYAGKGRLPVLRHLGGLQLEDPDGLVGIEIHLLLDESGQSATTYQVPLTCRDDRLAGADQALVATINEGTGEGTDEGTDDGGTSATRYIYDAPHDPAFAAALLRLMHDEQHLGIINGHRVLNADTGRLVASRVLAGEQSNTSIVLDLVDPLGVLGVPGVSGVSGVSGGSSNSLICKLFRVLHHGENPDVVVQSALAVAGSTRVPRSVGYIDGQWPDASAPDGIATGHLAFAQEFLPGVEDAWRVALAAVASGSDFSERAHSLGQATAQVHATLAEAMGTRAATQDDALALARSMQARHAAALSEVPALASYDAMVESSIDAVTSASWPALQRIHGDYHLGQVLDAPGRGWVLVDFEGEPLRPLAERSQPDLVLRDVAGMLRSFDYVAGSWEQANPRLSSAGQVESRAWATRARAAFLEGYTDVAGHDPRDDAVLLDALELSKALYEVIYEARNRPTWLSIPIKAIDRIARLSAGRRSDLRS